MPIAHAPAEHVAEALAKLHTLPQPPQWAVLVVLASQPLAAMPSQSTQPASHAPSAQALLAHAAAAWA